MTDPEDDKPAAPFGSHYSPVEEPKPAVPTGAVTNTMTDKDAAKYWQEKFDAVVQNELESRNKFVDTIEALRKERDELRYLFDSAARFVMPGECDSSDAYLKLFNQFREQVARLESENKKLAENFISKTEYEDIERELSEAKALGTNHTFANAEYFKKLQAENAELRAELDLAQTKERLGAENMAVARAEVEQYKRVYAGIGADWKAHVDERKRDLEDKDRYKAALERLLGMLLPYDKDGKINPAVTVVNEALKGAEGET